MSSPCVTTRQLAAITVACLLLSITFFAPRLWLMKHYVKGSFQWDRAHTFLLQCEQPMRRDIEAAMQWRILPPLVSHLLKLPGNSPLVVPWIGVIGATAYVSVLCRRRINDWRYVAGGTLLFATTSAVLVPMGWLGVNDAWVWLGLLAVAFGHARWAVPLACLLCPWIDERFLIGFPLAWLVGCHDRGESWNWPATRDALWLLPYGVVRIWLGWQDAAAIKATDEFLAYDLQQTIVRLPLVPLGWWMGLRAGWVAVAFAIWTSLPRRRLLAAITLLGTGAASVVFASDLSRSIAILIPVVFLGAFEYSRRVPATAPRDLLALGIANLLIPAAHVTYTHIDPINPLPIEILRWLRPS